MSIDLPEVTKLFSERFGEEPKLVVRAPGRVNLIGEHTDYNDGFVLPLAINRAIWIAARPRDDGQVIVHSINYDEPGSFSLEDLGEKGEGWIEYIKATAWSLQDAGHKLTGFEGIVTGDVPLGAGLSSSAALEMATARTFAAVSELDWNPAVMAKLGQRAESGHVVWRDPQGAPIGRLRTVGVAHRTESAGDHAVGPTGGGITEQQPARPALDRGAIPTGHRPVELVLDEAPVIEAQRRVTRLDLGGLSGPTQRTLLCGQRPQQRHGARLGTYRALQRGKRSALEPRLDE